MSSNMRILVVDDEKDIQTLFEQKFRKEISNNMVEFAFAFSGHEALEYLEKESNVNLILSDINMPGMSGIELLKQVKHKFPESAPEVFMITAYSDSENSKVASSLGAQAMFSKPIDFSLLKQKLNNLV
jgi:two-component system chemotaxis response regulator CheY